MAFKVQLTGEGAAAKIELIDTTNNTVAEVFAFGGLLNKFQFEYANGTCNVIDGFKNTEEAQLEITPFFKSAKLSPFVCRVNNAAYHFGEDDHKLSKYLTNGNAIHGLIYDKIFKVTETNDKEDFALVKLEYAYDNLNEGYPFHYKCEVAYQLQPNNTLSITTKVYNLDDKLIPVTDGWHPYFTLGDTVDDCQLEFQSKEMLEFDENLIPTGKLIPYQVFGSLEKVNDVNLNNCFTVNFAECQPMCVFRNPKEKIQVEIYPEESYPYLQVFTPDHRKSIAIENLSAAPDAFNNGIGLQVLEPGQSVAFTTKYALRSL